MKQTQTWPNKVPTYNLDTKEWAYTDFESRKSVIRYIRSKVKTPGKYNLRYTEGVWNAEANVFRTTNAYTAYPSGSQDYKKHWDFEKEKCNFFGFIIYKKPSEDLEYAVPGLYYFYLNYCPIPDKVKGIEDFIEIWDSDLHYYYYIYRCILERKYAVTIKSRQKGYTLKNMSIMLCRGWFYEKATCKIFAKQKNKVEEAWTFMAGYRNHINKHCAFKRSFDPGEGLFWEQKRKLLDGTFRGNGSIFRGLTTHANPTNGIGGSAAIIYGEEFGSNDSGQETHEFITSNVSMGALITGLVMYSGAVGSLDDATALREFVTRPRAYGFLPQPNQVEDDAELGEEVGFFCPESWNYTSVETDEKGDAIGEPIKCYDRDGNSDIDFAVAEIMKWRELAKKRDPESYQMYISQRPLSIREAFAYRKESRWPIKLIEKQIQAIKDGKHAVEFCTIELDDNGKPHLKTTTKLPIREYPLPANTVDKEGSIEIFERPMKEFEPFKTYVASIDPIKAPGKTRTSESLFCIMIYKIDIEILKLGDELESTVEPGKLVAEWTGRFDEIKHTHERARYLLEIYQCKAVVEANAYQFCTYMIDKKRQHYLVPTKHMLFLGEIKANPEAFQEYGWSNSGKMFETHLTNYGVEFMKEEVGGYKVAGKEELIPIRGITRIPSIMLLKEALAWVPGVNCDRLIAFTALVAYVKIYLANYGYTKKRIYTDGKKKAEPMVLTKSFFRNRSGMSENFNRSAFKNLK